MTDNQPPSYPGDEPGQQPNEPTGNPQQPYGGQQPSNSPYGAPPPHGAPGQWHVLPKHPQATLILVLGILSLVVCQVMGPFAWVMGNRAVAEIDANPGVYDGRSEAQAGRILGIIATVILILSVLAVAFFIVLMIIGIASTSTSTSGDYSELSLISLA